jgi:tRNA U34 5-carboxymethylaminomethyl modifying enzyme MnmG/GidA
MPKMRNFVLGIAKIVTRILYGTKVTDPHSWYRVISLSALRKFVITADGMHYANELNEQIRRHHMKYKEVPIHIKYTEYSMHNPNKWHRNKNSDSFKLAAEMIYKKIFFR